MLLWDVTTGAVRQVRNFHLLWTTSDAFHVPLHQICMSHIMFEAQEACRTRCQAFHFINARCLCRDQRVPPSAGR